MEEQPARTPPRLLSQLRASQDTPNPLAQDECALTKTQSCCQGFGIKMVAKGAYAAAELCGCIKACRICVGRAQNTADGFARPCRTPSPVKICNILNEATIPVRYQTARLDNFSNNTGNHQQLVPKIKAWAQQFNNRSLTREIKGLILAGNVGVGKTFLLVSIGKALAFKGLSVKFVDFFQLITEIKAQLGNRQEFYHSLLAPLINVDILLIDELGKGRQTEFEHTIIDQLVMGRYNQNKVIVASTNCLLFADQAYYAQRPLDQEGQGTFNPKAFPPLVDTVGERIYSRLVETTHMWELTGEDFRRKRTP